MGLRDILASWLSGSRDASLEPRQHVEQLRTAFGAAEREHTEATRRRDDAAAALAAEEQAYDIDATGENGAKVLRAREARDLAALRADRAAKRLEEARAALDAAERDMSRARLEKARAEAHARAPEIRRAVDSARATLARSNPAEAISHVVATFERTEAEARAALASATAEIEVLPGELGRIEAELVTLAPELAPELTAARAAREEQARAELARRVSVAAFREEIAGDLAVIAAAEAIADKHRARAAAALAAQRSAAVEASKLGVEAKPIDEPALQVHILHARYLAKLPAERDAQKHAAELWNMLLPDRRYSGWARVSHDEVIDLCLSAHSRAELVGEVERIGRDRAAAENKAIRTQRAAEQQTLDEPPPAPRTMTDIMGDYLPRIGGVIAPGLGRRAS